MEFTKKAKDLKRGLPRFRHRLVQYCRRLFAVLICTSMVLGGFPSAFYEALAADGDGDYVYELDGTAIYEALDTAIADGTTLDSELRFSGDHKAEYDELFDPDGTLYELEDLEFERDLERDKEVGLRVFVRIEGDIALDEAYEVDGNEEVIFLLTNKTDEEVSVQIDVDGYYTDVIEIPAAKDIPVEIDKDSTTEESDDIAAAEEIEGLPGGGGAGAGSAEDGTYSSTESEENEEDADAEANSVDSTDEDGEEDSASDDAEKENSTKEDSGEKEGSSKEPDKDSDDGSDKEASSNDGSDRSDAGSGSDDKDSSGDKDSSDKDSSNDRDLSGGSGSSDDKDSSKDKDSSDDKGSSKDKESSKDSESSKNSDSDKDSSNDNGISRRRGSSRRNSDSRTRGEKTASISVNKMTLVGASIEIEIEPDDEADAEEIEAVEDEPEAEVFIIEEETEADQPTDEDADDETASPSDASPSDAWSINGTVFEPVRIGNRGAVAYLTTAEDLGLDKMLPASTKLTYEGEDYIVTVSYGRDAGLPRGVELTASEYEKDSDTYQERLAEAARLNDWDDSVFEERVSYDEETGEAQVESITDHIRLFDISLNKDGAEVEPEAEVEVAISYLDSEAPDDDLETEYTIIHFSDASVETIETETEYQDEEETQVITFSIGSFSDVMVIDNGIVTYSAAVPASPDYFNFITPNLNMDAIEDSKITDQNDTFYIIPDDINPVSSGTAQLKMNWENIEIVDDGGGLISMEEFYPQTTNPDLKLILLDLEEAGLTSKGGIDQHPDGTVNYGIYDTTFDNYVSGEGYTIENVGTIKFNNASVVDGKSVDVYITLNSVRLYNSYATEFIGTASNRQVALKDNKLAIANADSSKFWISLNYVTSGDVGYGSDGRDLFRANTRYSSYFYDYTCLEDVDVTVNVVWADGDEVGETVDKEFLQVVSDIDVYHNDSTNPDDYRVFGYFAETFKTLDGFSGTYYIYNTDVDGIWADPAQPTGVVWVQARADTGGTTGDDSYKKTGLYADTKTGEWQIGYSEGWCGTAIEVYNYTTNDIIVKKVDDSEDANPLEGAEFMLARQTDILNPETDKPTGELNDIEYYTGTDVDDQGRTYSTWSSDIEDALIVSTTKDPDDDKSIAGQAIFEALEPCDHYYLTEVAAPNGYSILDHTIEFTLETYGVISLDPDNPDYPGNPGSIVSLDEGGSLNITIINHRAYMLPSTGSSGSEPYRTAGTFVSGSALWLLYITLRRRRRWLES